MASLIQDPSYKKWVASLGDIIYDNLYSNYNIKPEITSVAYTPSVDGSSGDIEVHVTPHVSSSTYTKYNPYIVTAPGSISGTGIISGQSYHNGTCAARSDDTEIYTQEDSLFIDYLKGIDPKTINKIVFKSEEYIKTRCCEKCHYGEQSVFDENYYYCELTKEWNRKDFYCGHSME